MSFSAHLCVVLLVASVSAFLVTAQNQFKVGGANGWRVPDADNQDLYAVWARNLRFQVGDSILFEYKNDSVIRVEKRGYYHCNESSQDSVSKDGSTIFLFDRPGLFYFVSGNFEHCKQGQRLVVDVMDSHGPPFAGAPGPSPASSNAANGCSASAPVLGKVLIATALSAILILKSDFNLID